MKTLYDRLVAATFPIQGVNMDKKIRNQIVSLGIAIVSLIAFANMVSGGFFSEPLHLEFADVDSTAYGGTDYDNWTDGNLCLGVTYDTGIQATASEDVQDFYMVAEIEMAGIQPGNATLQYWNGIAWNECSLTSIGPSMLRGTFPDAHYSMSKGDVMVIPILVTFQQCGDVSSRFWAEGPG